MASKRRLEKQLQSAQQTRMPLASLRRRAALDHYNAQFFQRALDTYEEAINLDPFHVAGHKGKADSLFALGRYEEARSSYEQCIQLDKSHAFSYEGLGNALYALQRYKEAS